MPTVSANLQAWNHDYEWIRQGEEWSSRWGSSEAQWLGSILPRVHAFIPTETILEIAPGYGRWTAYLKEHCQQLIVVDLADKCIQACRHRFAADSHITYHVNDGRSLHMVPRESVDFVFSFDSLVHAEAEVMDGYLTQLRSILKPNGVGFIHHSNIGYYRRSFLPAKIANALTHRLLNQRWFDHHHARAFSMSAATFEAFCDRAGLQCITQEQVSWCTRRRIDCLSLFTRRDSVWARPNVIVRNGDFMKEAALVRRRAALYSFDGAAAGLSRRDRL
jgi:SAM-dependent methyltransferase